MVSMPFVRVVMIAIAYFLEREGHDGYDTANDYLGFGATLVGDFFVI